MRLVNLTGRRRPDVQMSPLIDVVFLLLIFYAVTTQFVTDERLKLKLPEAKTAESAGTGRAEPDLLQLLDLVAGQKPVPDQSEGSNLHHIEAQGHQSSDPHRQIGHQSLAIYRGQHHIDPSAQGFHFRTAKLENAARLAFYAQHGRSGHVVDVNRLEPCLSAK